MHCPGSLQRGTQPACGSCLLPPAGSAQSRVPPTVLSNETLATRSAGLTETSFRGLFAILCMQPQDKRVVLVKIIAVATLAHSSGEEVAGSSRVDLSSTASSGACAPPPLHPLPASSLCLPLLLSPTHAHSLLLCACVPACMHISQQGPKSRPVYRLMLLP